MTDTTRRGSTVRASFILFGTIVGAGIFGLPRAVAESGYAAGLFWMLILAGAVTLTHLLYAEVIMATKEERRLVGYVGEYLGPWARRVETVTSILGLFGGSLAYLILGGLFLSQIASRFVPGTTPEAGSALLLLFGVAAVWGGTRFLSGADFWLTLVEMAAFLLLAAIAFTGFQPGYLATFHLPDFFLPYGIVLFAYGGLSAVSEVRAIAGGDPARVRKSVVVGTLMAAGLTIVFVTAVVGALGMNVTPESVRGLSERFGGSLPLIGAIAGFFSILTSYVVFSEYLNGQFRHDFRWPRLASAAAAVGTPFVLFLLGVRSFGRILELVGAVLIGIEGIFVSLMYLKVRRRPGTLKVPVVLVWLLMAAYAVGALYEIMYRVL